MRHGTSCSTESGLCSGRGSPCYGLTEKGREECRKSALTLNKKNIIPRKIYASPIKRCVESAEIIKEVLTDTSITIIKESALSERHYGEWENRSAAKYYPLILEGMTPPGGETDEILQARVRNFLSTLKPEETKHQPSCLVISHGGIWQSILDIYCVQEGPWIMPGDIYQLEINNGTLYLQDHTSH